MSFALRLRTAPPSLLEPIVGLTVRIESDPAQMAILQQRTEPEIAQRFDRGHRAYVAVLDDRPAAWGWVATREAELGELRTTLTLSPRDRYLWNFVTVREFRGRGIYPRLLDAIVRAESADADRFWIAYAPENHASGAGIAKAGFTAVADLSFSDDGRPAMHPIAPAEAHQAAAMLGLPVLDAPLAPCWRCVRAGRLKMTCAPGACACDYQIPASGCAS